MLRFGIKRGMLCAFSIPLSFRNSYDVDRRKKKDDSEEKVDNVESLGMERLKHMFVKSDGEITKEVQSIISATSICTFGSFLIGGTIQAAKTSEQFIKENQTTKFLSQAHANRELSHKMMLEFFKQGISFSWKIGLFAFLNQTIAVSLYTYRGKHEIRNYAVAGSIAASLFKIHLGIKGIMAAGIIGAMFGTLYGTILQTILYLSGTEIDEIYDANFEFMQHRRNKIRRAYVDDDTKEMIQKYEQNRALKDNLQNKEQVTDSL